MRGDKPNYILAIATIILAIATIALWYTSWRTLDETRKAAQGNLLLSLNRDFYQPDRLYKLRKTIEADSPILASKSRWSQFSYEDIDDYLGLFELMSDLINRNIIKKDLIYEAFGFYIVDAYENQEIHAYVAKLRKERKDPGIYRGFEELAKQFSDK